MQWLFVQSGSVQPLVATDKSNNTTCVGLCCMCLLCLLQDKAKPRPFRVVDRSLRLELGAGAEEVFAEFSAEATAAASLAQVHKARLMDGRQVRHL